MNQQQKSRRTLYAIAYGFDIATTVLLSFFIITMAWMIPMTIATKRAMDEVGKNSEISHLSLGICHIFFMGLVSGILIICAQSSLTDVETPINEENSNKVIEG
ncbi:hypothetical protein [Spiroplasma endosymbiont of Aspidapion aeneum]|uniref:hypothetical protein n=1 Tax=Spiroplasma endosymbiont of Aspidapion aeneum TaxID=3066276 RepID=UPI00313D8890